MKFSYDWVIIKKCAPDVRDLWERIDRFSCNRCLRRGRDQTMENEEAKETLDDILFSLQMRLRKSVHVGPIRFG